MLTGGKCRNAPGTLRDDALAQQLRAGRNERPRSLESARAVSPLEAEELALASYAAAGV
jgi:hypothetical protein